MGETFGPYRLLSLLGSGGMGEVWRARDVVKDRDVALKVLDAWLGADPAYARRFRREAALAARLSAPTIIGIHEYGEIAGRLFMEMPLIAGTDLGTMIERTGPFAPDRAVGVVEQVADALDSAHEAGLAHRDVKPSNVLVSTPPSGRDVVYLIDFGIARALDGTRITTTGREFGTLAYMAPERFSGSGDHRGDIYALACLLYQALTGRAPFVPQPGSHELGFYVNAHLNTPPPKPSQQLPMLPTALDEVITRGMAKDPANRYPSATELAMAARAALVPAHDVPAHVVAAPTDGAPVASTPPIRPVAPLTRSLPPPAVTDRDSVHRRGPAETSTSIATTSSAGPAHTAVWPLRSPARLAVTVVAVLVLGGGITYGIGAAQGYRAPASPVPPTATTPAPTAAPLDVEPQPPPPAVVAPPEALQIADRWAAAWLRPPDGRPRAQWLDGLRPYTTPEYLRLLSGVDPREVPATRVTSPATARLVSPQLVRARVLTDAEVLDLTVVQTDAGWRVSALVANPV